MHKLGTSCFGVLALLAGAAQLNAGGLWVVLGNPQANPQAQAMKAFVTAKMAGCHEPQKAKLTAAAIGEVHGVRKTIQLRLAPLAEPGAYALTRQWPAGGKWVLQFTGEENGVLTSSVIAVGADGVDRSTLRSAMRAPAQEDIEALLRAAPVTAAAR
jgi:hypothetical protein